MVLFNYEILMSVARCTALIPSTLGKIDETRSVGSVSATSIIEFTRPVAPSRQASIACDGPTAE